MPDTAEGFIFGNEVEMQEWDDAAQVQLGQAQPADGDEAPGLSSLI